MTPDNQYRFPVTPWQKVLRHSGMEFEIHSFASKYDLDPQELLLELASGHFQTQEVIAALAQETPYDVTSLRDMNTVYLFAINSYQQKTPETS